ncbi:MAG: carboxypeptidase-like regulatory domain-containing protein [Flavobacteriaceae bacterium]|nr:carboxypeptidase-like regulatory domain-containing protein [Flavobacteriaceae bacterium]
MLVLLLSNLMFVYSQKTITGTVSDVNGILPGITVVVGNTKLGVVTDFGGNYSIEVSEGEIMIFSYIGMKTKKITVGQSDVYNIIPIVFLNVIKEIELFFSLARQKI